MRLWIVASEFFRSSHWLMNWKPIIKLKNIKKRERQKLLVNIRTHCMPNRESLFPPWILSWRDKTQDWTNRISKFDLWHWQWTTRIGLDWDSHKLNPNRSDRHQTKIGDSLRVVSHFKLARRNKTVYSHLSSLPRLSSRITSEGACVLLHLVESWRNELRSATLWRLIQFNSHQGYCSQPSWFAWHSNMSNTSTGQIDPAQQETILSAIVVSSSTHWAGQPISSEERRRAFTALQDFSTQFDGRVPVALEWLQQSQ